MGVPPHPHQPRRAQAPRAHVLPRPDVGTRVRAATDPHAVGQAHEHDVLRRRARRRRVARRRRRRRVAGDAGRAVVRARRRRWRARRGAPPGRRRGARARRRSTTTVARSSSNRRVATRSARLAIDSEVADLLASRAAWVAASGRLPGRRGRGEQAVRHRGVPAVGQPPARRRRSRRARAVARRLRPRARSTSTATASPPSPPSTAAPARSSATSSPSAGSACRAAADRRGSCAGSPASRSTRARDVPRRRARRSSPTRCAGTVGRRDFTDLTGWDEAFEREVVRRPGAAGLLGVSLPAELGGGGRRRAGRPWSATKRRTTTRRSSTPPRCWSRRRWRVRHRRTARHVSCAPRARARSTRASRTPRPARAATCRTSRRTADRAGRRRLRARRREGVRDGRAQGRLVLHDRPHRSVVDAAARASRCSSSTWRHPGVEVERHATANRWTLSTIRFDGARVGADAVLGEVGQRMAPAHRRAARRAQRRGVARLGHPHAGGPARPLRGYRRPGGCATRSPTWWRAGSRPSARSSGCSRCRTPARAPFAEGAMSKVCVTELLQRIGRVGAARARRRRAHRAGLVRRTAAGVVRLRGGGAPPPDAERRRQRDPTHDDRQRGPGPPARAPRLTTNGTRGNDDVPSGGMVDRRGRTAGDPGDRPAARPGAGRRVGAQRGEGRRRRRHAGGHRPARRRRDHRRRRAAGARSPTASATRRRARRSTPPRSPTWCGCSRRGSTW